MIIKIPNLSVTIVLVIPVGSSHLLVTTNNIKNQINVRPEPTDDRQFQQLRQSGKSGILLGITLKPTKCRGVKLKIIPRNVRIR